ncbi:hypothetical protein ABXS75_17235 [Roseburia hominis]
MNVDHKKTAVDDDSILYQKRDDSFKKEDFSNLSPKQKFVYFKDYYLKWIIIGVIVLAVIFSLLNTMVFNRSNYVVSLTFLNECELEKTEELSADVKDYLKATGKNDTVTISSFNLNQHQMEMAYFAQASAGTIDLIVCSRDYFEEGAAQGSFADLSELLPEQMYESLASSILSASEAEFDDDGNPISYQDPAPYGIDISSSSQLEKYGIGGTDVVLCIARNADHQDTAIKMVSFFTDAN